MADSRKHQDRRLIEEADKRRDEIARRMLRTPPKPHKPHKRKKGEAPTEQDKDQNGNEG